MLGLDRHTRLLKESRPSVRKWVHFSWVERVNVRHRRKSLMIPVRLSRWLAELRVYFPVHKPSTSLLTHNLRVNHLGKDLCPSLIFSSLPFSPGLFFLPSPPSSDISCPLLTFLSFLSFLFLFLSVVFWRWRLLRTAVRLELPCSLIAAFVRHGNRTVTATLCFRER